MFGRPLPDRENAEIRNSALSRLREMGYKDESAAAQSAGMI